jgi:hypothetical protein
MMDVARNAADPRSGFGVLLVMVAAIAFSGCTELRSVERSISEPEGEICYAVATVPLHAKPSASSKVKGHLALHERVIRIRFETGYALVAVGGGGLEGWVENSKLARRNPATGATAKPPAREPASTPITESAEPLSTATPTE